MVYDDRRRDCPPVCCPYWARGVEPPLQQTLCPPQCCYPPQWCQPEPCPPYNCYEQWQAQRDSRYPEYSNEYDSRTPREPQQKTKRKSRRASRKDVNVRRVYQTLRGTTV